MNGLRLGIGMMVQASARTVPTGPPVNTSAPVIMGILTQGQVLSANPGGWSGLPSATFDYQWKRGATNIGTNSSTYTLVSGDVGQNITVVVTATNGFGPTSATSAAIIPAATLSISGTPGTATVGTAYTFAPTSAGGHTPKSFALTGTLPSGLSFSASTGAITGTPLSSGTASGLNITVTDTDGLTASLGTFSLVVSSSAPTVTFVTGFKVLGDKTYTTTSPAGGLGRMPTNGNTVEVTVNNGATTCDPSKLLITVRNKSWVNGIAGPDVDRVLRGVWHIKGPYNDLALFRPGGSTFHIVLDDHLYNANQVDSLGRTQNCTVVNVAFEAGFTTSSAAGLLPVVVPVTREDSESWPIPNFRHMSDPHRINDGTLEYEVGVVCRWARNGKPVDSVRAWAYSGGTDRTDGASGGTSAVGPSDLATSTVFSRFTPTGNPTAQMGQQALRVRCYRLNISKGSLPDTADPNNPADGVIFQVMPHIGMDYSSLDIGDAWIGGTTITPNLPKVLPMIINQTGKYNRRFLWVNANRTAGASPAVQTGTSDPGSTASYGLWKLAVDAGIAANVARGHPAGSMTGLVIMLRDIAGSVRGANDDGAGGAGAYSVGGGSIWSSTTNYRGMLEVCRASQWGVDLYSVVRSNLCRMRGVDTAGTGINGRSVAPKIRWIAMEFDSTGTNDTAQHPTTNANPGNTIFGPGGAGGTTSTLYVNQAIQCFFGCRKEDNSRTVAVLSNTGVTGELGHQYEFNMVWPTAITGQAHDKMNGIVVSVGSFYDAAKPSGVVRENSICANTGLFGVWMFGGGIATQGAISPTPNVNGSVLISVRMDAERSSSPILGAVDRRNGASPLGMGICGLLLVRKNFTGSYSGPAGFVAGDQSRLTLKNYVWQHVLTACAGQIESGRINGPYNDAGPGMVRQDFILMNSAPSALPMKNGFFNDSTTPQGNNEGAHNPANAYVQGNITHDNNATVSARIYKYALTDVPASTLFSNAAYWQLITTATPTTAYAGEPDRNGNMRARCGVGWRDNEFAAYVGADKGGEDAESWWANCRRKGEVRTTHTGDPTTWVMNDQSGTSAAAFTDVGDYRANPSGQLANRVRAGGAVTSHDPYGTARPNDGTGAIGFAEAA